LIEDEQEYVDVGNTAAETLKPLEEGEEYHELEDYSNC